MAGRTCAVVNLKSGGKKSALFVQAQLEAELGSSNVMVLFTGEPSAFVENVERFLVTARPAMIIVAGGDGTLTFMMDIVKTLVERGAVSAHECHIAPFPLGTGNDLSATLGFGTGFARWVVLGRPRFKKMMRQIRGAHAVALDRWKLSIQISPARGARDAPATLSPFKTEKIMSNYFSIGFDATCARDLNSLRHRFPFLFPTRPIVKLWYAVFAVSALFTQRRIGASVSLRIDGQTVTVPANTKALIVSNVPSYAGGSAVWNANTDKELYTAPCIDDGKVEVLCLSGVWHLALIRMALCHGTKLGQGSRVEIKAPSNLSCQYDGEFMEELRSKKDCGETVFSIAHYSQATLFQAEPHHTPHLIYAAVLLTLLCGLIPYFFF